MRLRNAFDAVQERRRAVLLLVRHLLDHRDALVVVDLEVLYPAEGVVRVKRGKRLPLVRPRTLALCQLVPVESSHQREEHVERSAVEICCLLPLLARRLLEKRLRLVLPRGQFRNELRKLFGRDVARHILDLGEDAKTRSRRIAGNRGEALCPDEDFGDERVRLLHGVSGLFHLVVYGKDILRPDCAAELGAFEHLADLLAADAPVAAGL